MTSRYSLEPSAGGGAVEAAATLVLPPYWRIMKYGMPQGNMFHISRGMQYSTSPMAMPSMTSSSWVRGSPVHWLPFLSMQAFRKLMPPPPLVLNSSGSSPRRAWISTMWPYTLSGCKPAVNVIPSATM